MDGRAGVVAFTRAAAEELEPHNIRVNAICPNQANLGESGQEALSLCREDHTGIVIAVGEN